MPVTIILASREVELSDAEAQALRRALGEVTGPLAPRAQDALKTLQGAMSAEAGGFMPELHEQPAVLEATVWLLAQAHETGNLQVLQQSIEGDIDLGGTPLR